MNTAYVKETGKYITAQEYRDELHLNKIYCPECYKAPLYFVPKQKTIYFRVENREDHLEDCSFYQEFIPNQEVVRLIKSEKEVDKERLKFLIEMNMRNALNLLRRQNTEPLINKVGIENSNNPKKTTNKQNRPKPNPLYRLRNDTSRNPWSNTNTYNPIQNTIMSVFYLKLT